MSDQLSLFGGLDQPMPIDSKSVLENIDIVIQTSIERKDMNISLNYGKQIVGVTKLSGLALAKLLYLTKKNWSAYESKEEFDDIAYIEIGVHKDTVSRYVKIWAMFTEGKVPAQYVPQIQQKYVTELINIANAIAQGYEIENEAWEKIADAPDQHTVAKIIREDVKHKEPRADALQLVIDEIGSIWAWQAGVKYFVGSLEIMDDRPAIQQAIERIRRTAGIMDS